jgi:hypothetical protein
MWVAQPMSRRLAMNHKALTSVVVTAALLLGAACSGGDDDAAPAGGGDQGGEAAATGDGGNNGNGNTGNNGNAEGGRPQDSSLDIEVRHPNGVVLRVNSIAFEGDDVALDTEVVNSSRETITFHPGNFASNRLRLIDDAGEEYNFIETQEDQPIELAPGDTLSGTMAFRGPLLGETEQLQLVTNVYTEDVGSWKVEDESETTYYPGFVVPIELTWQ